MMVTRFPKESGEGFELLDAGSSDSGSEQEHFSMKPLGAPIRGNRGKADKNHNRKKKGEQCCTLQQSLICLLSMVLCACLAVLTLYTYRLHEQIDTLEQKFEENQSQTSVQPDPQNAQIITDLKAAKEDLNELKSQIEGFSQKDFDYMKSNISNLNRQVNTLNTSMAKLSKVNLPVAYADLPDQVATLGSDLQTVISEMKDLPTVENIKNLQEQINSLNESMRSQIGKAKSDLDILRNTSEGRYLQLSLEMKSDKGIGHLPDMKQLVRDAIQETIKDWDNFTVPGGDNQAAMENMLHDFDQLNHTIIAIKAELLSNQQLLQDMSLAENITEIRELVDQVEENLETYKITTNQTIQKIKTNLLDVSNRIQNIHLQLNKSSSEHQKQLQMSSATDVLFTTIAAKEEMTDSDIDGILLPGIYSIEDLEERFQSLDTDNDNLLSLEELGIFDNTDLTPFDTNRDGLYSKEELEQIFVNDGFKSDY